MEVKSPLREFGSWWLFFRYACSGAVSVIAQYFALGLMIDGLGMLPTLSSAISYLFSCVINYLMLYLWVFKSGKQHHLVALRYLIVTGSTLWVNTAIFYLLVNVYDVWHYYGQAVATTSVSLINFYANKYYAFD